MLEGLPTQPRCDGRRAVNGRPCSGERRQRDASRREVMLQLIALRITSEVIAFVPIALRLIPDDLDNRVNVRL